MRIVIHSGNAVDGLSSQYNQTDISEIDNLTTNIHIFLLFRLLIIS